MPKKRSCNPSGRQISGRLFSEAIVVSKGSMSDEAFEKVTCKVEGRKIEQVMKGKQNSTLRLDR